MRVGMNGNPNLGTTHPIIQHNFQGRNHKSLLRLFDGSNVVIRHDTLQKRTQSTHTQFTCVIA